MLCNTCFRAEEDAEIARRLEQDLMGEDVAVKRQRELHDEVTISLMHVLTGDNQNNKLC